MTIQRNLPLPFKFREHPPHRGKSERPILIFVFVRESEEPIAWFTDSNDPEEAFLRHWNAWLRDTHDLIEAPSEDELRMEFNSMMEDLNHVMVKELQDEVVTTLYGPEIFEYFRIYQITGIPFDGNNFDHIEWMKKLSMARFTCPHNDNLLNKMRARRDYKEFLITFGLYHENEPDGDRYNRDEVMKWLEENEQFIDTDLLTWEWVEHRTAGPRGKRQGHHAHNQEHESS